MDAAMLPIRFVSHDYGIHSDTFKTIEKEILALGPKIVIIEGASDLDNKKRERLAKKALSCEADSFLSCGENLYGIALAIKNGLLWTSAEPAEKLVRESLLKRGFSLSDISFFYVARQMRQLRVEKNLSQENLAPVINQTLSDFAEHLSMPKNLNVEMFFDWFQKKMHKPFVLSEIDSETTAPTNIVKSVIHQSCGPNWGLGSDNLFLHSHRRKCLTS
jgi:hypothetical protein